MPVKSAPYAELTRAHLCEPIHVIGVELGFRTSNPISIRSGTISIMWPLLWKWTFTPLRLTDLKILLYRGLNTLLQKVGLIISLSWVRQSCLCTLMVRRRAFRAAGVTRLSRM